MTFEETIRAGMKLIIEGCRMNPSWRNCENCPFDRLCTSIYRDNSHNFSTPDCWEEEGIWLNLEEK